MKIPAVAAFLFLSFLSKAEAEEVSSYIVGTLLDAPT